MRIQENLSLKASELRTLLNFFPQGLVAFDLEMTGLSPLLDKIIEIAAVKVLPDGRIENFHALINPLIEIPKKTTEFHMITDEMVKDAPTLKKPLKSFIEFYGNLPLVAHNAQFDIGFLIRGIHQYNFPIGLSDVFDTCKMARLLFKNSDKNVTRPIDYKLSSLASFYGFKLNHHMAHDDAWICLKIFIMLLQKIEEGKIAHLLKDKAFLFKLNSFQKASHYELPKKFDLLKEKVMAGEAFQMIYKGGSTGNEPRPVRPIALMPMPTGLVLYGECLLSKLNKSFLVKKIKKVEEIEV